MNQTTRNVVEALGRGELGPPGKQPPTEDSRTWAKQCLVETVVPVLTLLCMSVLTVTLIVSVVTAVAHGGWLTPATYVSVDPWATLHSDSGGPREDAVRYPDSAVFADLSPGPQANAGHVAAELPE